MESKLIITRQGERIITALLEDGKICEFRCDNENAHSQLGNIYVGRVKNIVKNIQVAFIEIANGVSCYYPLEDCEQPHYTKKINSPKLVAGDELLVQVCKESNKTKPPTVTANLNFTGKYLVLTTGKCHLGLSGKLNPADKKRLKKLILPLCTPEFGFIVRTNASDATEEDLRNEARTLIETCQKLIQKAGFSSCFSLMYQNTPPWVNVLKDMYSTSFTAVITDDDTLYAQIKAYLTEYQPEDLHRLHFYEDKLLPLTKLYHIEKELSDALRERVWLKSGAYLVIQPTEALTVFDVNTGKYEGKKKQQDTFLKINLEAAEEIARQLRLRNISGIIVIDFINLKTPEYREELMRKLEVFLKKDPIKTVLVDITPLDLVEITRKKIRKPLIEQMSGEIR